MIYFSARTRGFYPTDIVDIQLYKTKGAWPEDAVEVTTEDYKKYLALPPDGMVLGSINGGPAWVVREGIEKKEAVLLAELKKEQRMRDAENAIAPLVRAEKYGEISDGERLKLESLEKYTILLNRVNPHDAPDIEWPQMID